MQGEILSIDTSKKIANLEKIVKDLVDCLEYSWADDCGSIVYEFKDETYYDREELLNKIERELEKCKE